MPSSDQFGRWNDVLHWQERPRYALAGGDEGVTAPGAEPRAVPTGQAGAAVKRSPQSVARRDDLVAEVLDWTVIDQFILVVPTEGDAVARLSD